MFPYLISHIMDRVSRSASCLLPFASCLFLSLSFAYAGEYHAVKEKTKINQEVLACSQCHTMHGTQGSVSMIYGGAAAVYTKLLRQATIVQLCLYCHSNDQAGMCPGPPCPPNIWSSSATGGAVVNPSAGLLCADGSAIANPPCGTINTNHTVGAAGPISIPGTNPVVQLSEFTCVNCHNPHGTTNYRNLRNNSYGGIDFTGVDVSYAYSTAADPNNNAYYVNNWAAGLTKYQTGNVRFRKSVSDVAGTSLTQGIQAFCKACHTKFHYYSGENSTEMGGVFFGAGVGAGDTGTPWLRHPTSDVSMTQGGTNLHVDNTYWTSASWRPRVVDPDGTAGNMQPFCLSCHRAHGSSRHSNLIYGTPDTVGGSNEASTAMMRDTCQQCHNQ